VPQFLPICAYHTFRRLSQVSLDGQDFTFWCRPYLLNLRLPCALQPDDGDTCHAKYLPDEGDGDHARGNPAGLLPFLTACTPHFPGSVGAGGFLLQFHGGALAEQGALGVGGGFHELSAVWLPTQAP
jgi:hypothetical protein